MKKRTIIAAVLILIIGVIAITAGCNRQLQIKIEGVTYLVHANNVALIAD